MIDDSVDGGGEWLPAALRHCFPDIGIVEPIHPRGAGFRSMVIETAQGIVVRIGKNAAAAERYAREMRLLPVLQSHLAFGIPQPRWYAPPCADFPFGVMGYPRVPGIPLSPGMPSVSKASLATGVGYFLHTLHRFPIEQGDALDIPQRETRGSETVGWRDTVLPVLRDALGHDEYGRVVGWWDAFLLDRSLDRYIPALIHGDLWYEHVLADAAQQNVTGVIDFESAAIGDIAWDFAVQRHVGVRVTNLVIAVYRRAGGVLEDTIEHRVQRLWEIREFEGLAFAIRTGDTVEIEDSLRKLRAGPILCSGSPLPRVP